MYIKVVGDETTEYRTLKNLSFSDYASISGTQLSISRVEVDVLTGDKIDTQDYLELYDEVDTLYVNFPITYAEREVPGFVHVIAESELVYLDHVGAGRIYTRGIPETMEDELFAITQRTKVNFDYDELPTARFSGILEWQTYRDRLMWAAFLTGALVRQSFNPLMKVETLSDVVQEVPMERTYWRPELSYEDYVSAVKATAFTLREGTPAEGDEYIDFGDFKVIVSRNEVKLENPKNTEVDYFENEVGLNDCMAISQGNVGLILSKLAFYHFGRITVTFDCINSWGQWKAGDLLKVWLDEEGSFAIGYAERMDYTFGNRVRTTVKLAVTELGKAVKLIINYKSKSNPPGNIKVATRTYFFPAGYNYSVEAEYPAITMGGHRYVFRPSPTTITGTMGEGVTTKDEDCYVALDLDNSTKILRIVSVDAVELDGEGIAEIS